MLSVAIMNPDGERVAIILVANRLDGKTKTINKIALTDLFPCEFTDVHSSPVRNR